MMQGVKDFPSFFQNVSRMLRPGGVLLIMDGRFVTWDEERQLIEYKEEGQPVRQNLLRSDGISLSPGSSV